ncbi:MAG TPA: tripartite tricarboxylate transporter substrate binding protein [Alphaproteobacteria bacterium]
MNINRRYVLHVAAAVIVGCAVTPTAWAQSYPDRPVRVIVPYAPGGPTDIIARLVSLKLSEQAGKQFYIENIPGGGGNIGMSRAAQATPDGYTVLFVAPPYVVNPSLYAKVPFDHKNFDPITLAVNSAIVLTVHPSVPATTVKELIALIKANPGKYSYASPGIGTPPHLLGELFRMSLQLDVVHVPFNSGGLAIGSAVAGHTPISFGSTAPAVPHIDAGKLRALAVTSTSRTQALPQVPTMVEAGYPEIVGGAWFGVVVPAGTPREIAAWLNREIGKVLALPDVKDRAQALGFEPVGNSPEEFAAVIKADGAKWAKVIKGAGIQPR